MAAAVLSSGAASRHEDVFTSIFPKKDFSQPTPESTPNIGTLASPGVPFRGFNGASTFASDIVKLTRAWSIATRHLLLALDTQLVSLEDRYLEEVQNAVLALCGIPQKRKELVAWYSNEVSIRFRASVLPQLDEWHGRITGGEHASKLLHETIAILGQAQERYIGVLQTVVVAPGEHHGCKDSRVDLLARVKTNLHIQVLDALPRRKVEAALTYHYYDYLVCNLHQEGAGHVGTDDSCTCTVNLADFPLACNQDLGLHGPAGLESDGSQALPNALIRFLQYVVRTWRCFAVDWSHHGSALPKLRRWISASFAPSLENYMTTKRPSSGGSVASFEQVLEDQAIHCLGRQRCTSIFDYIKAWPHSKGAMHDIKDFITYAPAEKTRVCGSFSQQIESRLLHAGASTAEILSVYINVIHAFRLLDSRGVLLDKVSGPVRGYLRSRDDTVGIIAASFLADVDEQGNAVGADASRICLDITVQVANSALQDARDHQLLNLNDMNWMPDPIDAGPDYKAVQSEDVVDYILGLFDQEDFIKEITKVLAQRLLEPADPEYIKETRLIELLKSRKMDATKLQAAEVMLKDVRESALLSRRITPYSAYKASSRKPDSKEIQAAVPPDGITFATLYWPFRNRINVPEFQARLLLVANRRGELYFPKRILRSQDAVGEDEQVRDDIGYNVQVVSSFFWPQMRTNHFSLPELLAHLDEQFGQRFAALGNQRKLHFRRALARVTVELELEDRSIMEDDVPAWRASVIDAFAAQDYNPDVGLTPDHLVESLQMGPDLVSDALRFWMSRSVLYQPARDTYAVLERLDMDRATVKPTEQPPVENMSAVMSQDAMLRESAPMFETFIHNMLQNSGPKEIGGMMGITNMLKMVLPIFTYGDDEVEWLLVEMEKKGTVAKNAELWAVVR